MCFCSIPTCSPVADEIAQSITIGEVQHAITPIYAVIICVHTGRSHEDVFTLFDGTGAGLQHLAVAVAAVKLAQAGGKGLQFEFQ